MVDKSYTGPGLNPGKKYNCFNGQLMEQIFYAGYTDKLTQCVCIMCQVPSKVGLIRGLVS